MKEKELNTYFKKLRKHLRRTHSSKQADDIIVQLQYSSVNYFQENPNASFEDFIEEFGDIEEIDLGLVENAQELSKLTNTVRFRRKILLLIIVIIVFVKLLDYGLWMADYTESKNHEIIQEETIIY